MSSDHDPNSIARPTTIAEIIERAERALKAERERGDDPPVRPHPNRRARRRLAALARKR